LLVDTEVPRIDLIRRSEDGSWSQQRYEGLETRLEMPVFGASLRLVDVFEGLDFEE
jgi:hypothetical protein